MTYTVKDIARITGLSIFTIHFYDKEGLLPFVSRNKSGNRAFTESDVRLIQMICCLKNTGMQIKNIKKYIDFCMEGADTIPSRKSLLLEHRKEIITHINALKENLDLIDSKLEIYDSPNAVEIINQQIEQVNHEKQVNCLLSHFAKNNESGK